MGKTPNTNYIFLHPSFCTFSAKKHEDGFFFVSLQRFFAERFAKMATEKRNVYTKPLNS